MALDKTTLKTTIVQIMNDMLTREENSIEEYAERLSNAIDAFVKTGAVTVTVTTTGTATAQSGSGTGTIN